jgi:murein DD-endopeptidase MepM/ murein hydrolase activator NlpD
MRDSRSNRKSIARAALAAVVLLGGLMVLPRPASRIVTPDASAQIPVPTPTIPDILPDPDPNPTETESPKPKPKPKPTKDPENNEKPGGGDEDPGNTGGSDPGDTGGDAEGQTGNTGRNGGGKKAGEVADGTTGGGKNKLPKPDAGTPRIPGSYTTDKLVSVAARLRSLGRPADEVVSKVFSPFIIGGEAAWIDTWGAPRYGPGPIVRTHEGQDVFCNFGDPVLATEPGTVEFDDGGLGGKIARLHRPDGSYWYYAHLSAFNTKDYQNGDRVDVGDVIGYCGNTGNALTTPPHVHFGWYQANGEAKNPMLQLVRWLRQAERKAGVELTKRANERVENIEPLTLAYRFGDAFTPDTSVIGIAGESLFAYGSTPSAGSLSVVQSALQAALSPDASELTSEVGSADNLAGPVQSELDPDSELAELIFGEDASHESAD